MSDITVIGLGLMGSALAKTLLTAGHEVTVWNRSREKAEPFVSSGAKIGETIADAIEVSRVILVCINNYATTMKFFEKDDTLSILKGRIVVQMSSGTPQEAIRSERWFQGNSIGYLDGAILGSPKDIGTKEGQILIAGDDSLWRECKPVLKCLAGNFQHTGTKIDSAKILDLAWLSQRLGLYMGVFQGLLLCKAAGVGLDVFGSTVAADERISMVANTIHTNTFTDPINTIKVWKEALHHIQIQAQNTDTNNEVLEFIAEKFQRAYSAGYEEEDIAALIKVFWQK
jgi:3-hydroxyisobutyrate dehydrogenase-like beta-hydroxyacid dehydrogenase